MDSKSVSATADTRFDVAPILDEGRWTAYQKTVLALAALAIVLDGFDNQVLGFALPAITRDWHVGREAFAPVFAVGFGGMVLGTMAGGWLGDRIGRRFSLIASVLIFGLFTGLTTFVDSVWMLGLCRFLAGFGLGGAMPGAATLIAEFSPANRRSIAVTIGIVCVPLGGVIGGFIAAQLLPFVGWRALFMVGGALPLAVALLLFAALPESPRFLVRRPNRHAELAKIMRRMGQPVEPTTVFYDSHERADMPRASVAALFAPGWRMDTLALWIAFFFCLSAIYVVFSWAPSLLVASGFDVASASRGLAFFNVGGVAGALLTSLAMTRFGSRIAMLTVSGGTVVSAALLALGSLPPTAGTMVMLELAVVGAFANATQTGLYALGAQMYPVQVRSTGVGAAAGLGRTGAIVASFVGAMLVSAGSSSYFAGLAGAMSCTFVALAVIRHHVPKIAPSR